MISIGLVYYSGEEFLKKSLETLLAQSFSDFEILIRDQSDTFFAEQFIVSHYGKEGERGRIKVFTGENLMHSGGHNFLLSKMRGEVYVCGSVDMEYASDFLKNLNISMDMHPNIQYFTGKILDINTRKIDSAGILQKPCFRFVDRGQGLNAQNFSQSEAVFGASGALCAFRKSLLEKISLGEKNDRHGNRLEIFDETLHYKNDVDVACRIVLKNEDCWYDSAVYACHHRQVGEGKQKSAFAKHSSFVGQQHLFQKYSGTKLLSFWKGWVCRVLHGWLYN